LAEKMISEGVFKDPSIHLALGNSGNSALHQKPVISVFEQAVITNPLESKTKSITITDS